MRRRTTPLSELGAPAAARTAQGVQSDPDRRHHVGLDILAARADDVRFGPGQAQERHRLRSDGQAQRQLAQLPRVTVAEDAADDRQLADALRLRRQFGGLIGHQPLLRLAQLAVELFDLRLKPLNRLIHSKWPVVSRPASCCTIWFLRP